MIGSIRMPAVVVADGRFDRVEIERRDLIEPVDRRAEALEMLGLAAGGYCCERPAMEGAFERHQPIALRRAGLEMIAARGLDRAFDRFRAGIGEERHVGEGGCAQPRGQPLLFGNAVQIGHMPQFFRLLGQRLHEMRMGVTERGDRDPAGKVEITFASLGK